MIFSSFTGVGLHAKNMHSATARKIIAKIMLLSESIRLVELLTIDMIDDCSNSVKY